MSRVSSLTFLACVAAAPAAGQTGKIVPPFAASVDANSSSNFPFAFRRTSARMQQVVDGASIVSSTAAISEIAFRRDATNRISYQAVSVPVRVTIGHSSKTSATMSSVFAQNRSGAQVVAFQGTYDLPALLPVSGGPAKFRLRFKLDQPYRYVLARGALLIEITIAGLIREYHVDAHRAGPDGFSHTFGKSGTFASGHRSHTFFAVEPRNIKPGGTLSLELTNMRFGPPGLFLLGASHHRWGPLPLPLDLAPLGAPGNELYVRPDITLPFRVVNQNGAWRAGLRARIPNSAALAGHTWYVQPILIDPPSNPLGVVVANALSFTYGGGGTSTNAIVSRDANTATGTPLFGAGRGGPVIELRGVFQ